MKLMIAGAALALSACTTPAMLPEETTVTKMSDRAAILEQSRRFSAAYVANDVDTIMAIYGDGYAAPPGRDFLTGEALRKSWTTPEGRRTLSHKATPTQLEIHGDMAMDWGIYEGVGGKIGDEKPFAGKYVIVWKREADGVWRIAMDMWNAGPKRD